MRYPTRAEFRSLLIVGMVLIFISVVMESWQIPEPSEEVKTALLWNYYDAGISIEALTAFYYVILGGWIIGGISFLCFWKFGRWIVVGTMGLQILVISGSGLHVSQGLADAVGLLGGLIFFLPFYLSFFPPCEGYFRSKKETEGRNPETSSDCTVRG